MQGVEGRAPVRRLYKTNFSPVLDGRAVEKEEACTRRALRRHGSKTPVFG